MFDMVGDHRLHVFVGPEAPTDLARALHDAWVAFARSGIPTLPDGPRWPTVDDEGRPVLLFDAERTLVQDPQGGTRRFWDSATSLIG